MAQEQNSVCAYWLFQVEIPINIGYQPYRQILLFVTSMSAPPGKPSPGGTHPSGVSQAMAIEDADDSKTASDNPINTNSQTPSERSRSDKREVRVPLPPGAVVPQSGAQRVFTPRIRLPRIPGGHACRLTSCTIQHCWGSPSRDDWSE